MANFSEQGTGYSTTNRFLLPKNIIAMQNPDLNPIAEWFTSVPLLYTK